ncbi:ATPase [Zea mays]|uniref:ATPase n=2 Tax=Zea mays TaxID=4577 RepID=A0A1D6LC20_MAIZE|nr:ATPase [Zea mays]
MGQRPKPPSPTPARAPAGAAAAATATQSTPRSRARDGLPAFCGARHQREEESLATTLPAGRTVMPAASSGGGVAVEEKRGKAAAGLGAARVAPRGSDASVGRPWDIVLELGYVYNLDLTTYLLYCWQVHYFWPATSDARSMYEAMWHDITDQSGENIVSVTIPVMFGRSIEIPQSCNGVARFDFEYLCGRPVGAADYIAIARNYHTIFISEIPAMSMKIRDKSVWAEEIGGREHERSNLDFKVLIWLAGMKISDAAVLIHTRIPAVTSLNKPARRFITLIDELYNHHCRLICLAASSIDDLFQGTEEGPLFDLESFQFETESEGTKLRRDVLAEGNAGSGPSTTGLVAILSGQEEMFAFRRAISRLIEMQTPLYLERVLAVHPSFRRPGLARNNRPAVPQPAPAV